MIEILNFTIMPSKMRVGTLLVKYHDLIMKCDLVVWKKNGEGHLWVRMPESWFTSQKKTSFCYWVTEEKSKEFQKILLKKVFEEYAFDFEKAIELLNKRSGKKTST